MKGIEIEYVLTGVSIASIVQPDQLICLLGHALYFFINQVFMLTGALRFKTEFASYTIITSARLNIVSNGIEVSSKQVSSGYTSRATLEDTWR